jgi:hypothetical protein
MVFNKNATSASTKNDVDNPYELPGITALLGSGFHIKRQDLMAPNLYDDRQYSAHEVRVLIALALDAYSRQLRDDIREDMFSALDQLELRLLNKIDITRANHQSPRRRLFRCHLLKRSPSYTLSTMIIVTRRSGANVGADRTSSWCYTRGTALPKIILAIQRETSATGMLQYTIPIT